MLEAPCRVQQALRGRATLARGRAPQAPAQPATLEALCRVRQALARLALLAMVQRAPCLVRQGWARQGRQVRGPQAWVRLQPAAALAEGRALG